MKIAKLTDKIAKLTGRVGKLLAVAQRKPRKPSPEKPAEPAPEVMATRSVHSKKGRSRPRSLSKVTERLGRSVTVQRARRGGSAHRRVTNDDTGGVSSDFDRQLLLAGARAMGASLTEPDPRG